MDPVLIDQHRRTRGAPNWHEYAKLFRVLHVERRAVGIGYLFDAYMPDGNTLVFGADLKLIMMEAVKAGCHAVEIERAPESW